MTCQECELALAAEQNADEHLAVCAACRALAEEMRANAAAFESFAGDPLPSIRHKVMAQVRSQSAARQVLRWGFVTSWALAAAVGLVVGIAVLRDRQEEKMPPVQIAHIAPPVIPPHAPVEKVPPHRRGRKKESGPLMVKMLTSDPDVVIYWQIESEDEQK